jgi:hypothetical protein
MRSRTGRQHLPRQPTVALGVLWGAAFCVNGLIFVGSMIFLRFFLGSGHLRRVAVLSAAGTLLQSDGIRMVALALAGQPDVVVDASLGGVTPAVSTAGQGNRLHQLAVKHVLVRLGDNHRPRRKWHLHHR